MDPALLPLAPAALPLREAAAMPLVTLTDGIGPFLTAASIGAPLFAVLVIIDYWRVMRRPRPVATSTEH